MSATVELCESNGSTETITHNVSQFNMGNSDTPNMTYTSYPIPVGSCAFNKLLRYHVTGGTFNVFNNLQVYLSNLGGGWKTGESMQCNLNTTQGSYDTYKVTSFAQPSTTPYTAYSMPEADPASANLGIGGSLTGQLTGAGYSDYFKVQLKTTGSTPSGDSNQKTFTFQYDEQ